MIVEISSIRVENVDVPSRIIGKRQCDEIVEIFKNGEIYGKVTCRKLIVNKGETFNGKVKMLNVEKTE